MTVGSLTSGLRAGIVTFFAEFGPDNIFVNRFSGDPNGGARLSIRLAVNGRSSIPTTSRAAPIVLLGCPPHDLPPMQPRDRSPLRPTTHPRHAARGWSRRHHAVAHSGTADRRRFHRRMPALPACFSLTDFLRLLDALLDLTDGGEILVQLLAVPHTETGAQSLRIFEDEVENALVALTFAAIVEELIALAKEMNAAQRRGEALNLSDDELAFYDALEVNDSAVAVLGDEALRLIARELVSACLLYTSPSPHDRTSYRMSSSS